MTRLDSKNIKILNTPEIAKRALIEREKTNLSFIKMAKQSGVSVQTLFRLEHGLPIHLEKMQQVFEFYGIDIAIEITPKFTKKQT